MRWELGARYERPAGADANWFANALAELRAHVAGPVDIRVVFRVHNDERLHTMAGEIVDAPPGHVAVQPEASKRGEVPCVDVVWFKPLKGAGLPPATRQD